jgi:hypothetical protein
MAVRVTPIAREFTQQQAVDAIEAAATLTVNSLIADKLKLTNAAANPSAAGEIWLNGAVLNSYTNGAVHELDGLAAVQAAATLTVNSVVADKLRLTDASANPSAAGEIWLNGAALKSYTNGAVNELDNAFKQIGFTRDMTTGNGTQAVTGVGFTSKRVFFTARVTSDYAQHSEGVEDWPTGGSDTRFMWYDASNETSGVWSTDTANSILIMPSAPTAYRGKITTMGSDGFTITWVRTGAPSGTMNIRAYCER